MKNPISGSSCARSLQNLGLGLLILLGLLANTRLSAAGLSGTYTICASGCDYSGFSSAFADLNSKGVSGPVTFNVSAGTYTGSATLNAVSGSSSTNTITFSGAGVNSTIWSSTSSGVMVLQYSNYVIFDNIQFKYTAVGNAIELNYTSNISISNCKIIAPDYYKTSLTAYGIRASDINNIKITNCRFEGGYYSCYLYLNYGCTVSNNKFVSFYSVAVYTYGYAYGGQDVISGNVMDSSAMISSASTQTPFGIASYDDNGVTITNNTLNNCILNIYYPNNNSTATLSDISNNIVSAAAVYNFTNPLQAYIANSNVRISHNTFYLAPGATSNYGIYMVLTSGAAIQMTNNIFDFEGTITIMTLSINGSASNFTKLDGNAYYLGTGRFTLTDIIGGYYINFAPLIRDLNAMGFEKHSSYMKPAYLNASKGDLHLDKTMPNPFGVYTGISKDIDGDSRCLLFPSAGADESAYGKSTKPTAKFYGPDTVYYGNPTTFYNSAKRGVAEAYAWYVNGVKVSDSLNLVTTVKSGTSKVSLAVTNCVGKDSIAITFPTTYSSKAPVADFSVDSTNVRTGDIVHFKDISTNYPSSWTWSISPGYSTAGVNTPAFKYINGTSASSQNPDVIFLASGSYQVCLNASNTLKSGKTGSGSLCRTAYINVVTAVNLGSVSAISAPNGYLFDNGGPIGDYSSTATTGQNITIDGCADSTYLIFKSFGLYCGYDYLNIYDGVGVGRKSLIKGTCSNGSAPSTASGYWTTGPGYTGGGSFADCMYGCTPNVYGSGRVDTFKAGKQMYIEMKMYPGISKASPGFEAYWWTKPTSKVKPKASFITSKDAQGDSICQFGSISFTSTSTDSGISYLWDLDNNLADGYESVQPSLTWSYPFAGNDTVTLITMNCGGADTFTKVIKVFVPATPKANFSVSDRNPAVGDYVFITSNVTMCVDSYHWRIFKTHKGFGNFVYLKGTSASSQNPAVAFNDTGYYTIVQTLKNSNGIDSLVRSAFIKVRPAYCAPYVATRNTDLGISYVHIQDIDNKSAQGIMNYTSYVNDPSQKAYLQIGSDYNITVKRDSAFSSPITRTVYIDWQHNGNFVKAAIDSNNSTNATWIAHITVPRTASIGATVMRIAANKGSYTNKPCGGNEFGEYEDYRVYIIPDTTPPVLIVAGPDTTYISASQDSSAYTIPPSIQYAYDGTDSFIHRDISPRIILLNKLDTVKVTYTATDSAGNKTTVYRYVIVRDNIPPTLILKGDSSIYVGVNTSYIDSGVSDTDNYYPSSILDTLIVKTGSVDVNKVGTYRILYTLTDPSGNTTSIERFVHVIDTIAPRISIKGNIHDTVEVYSTYNDPGISATDNYYKGVAITAKGTFYNNFPTGKPAKLGVYTIVYTAADSSGNKDTAVRYIAVVDRTRPLIILLGDTIAKVCRWADYQDSGYTVSDNYYTNVKVDTEGTFITGGGTQVPGIYNLRFKAMDGSGNVSYSRYRILVVLSDTSSECKSGIKEGLALDKYIKVYPNPTNGLLTVSANLPDEKQVRLMISNSLGQRVGEAVNIGLGKKTYTIDLSAQAAGMYILNIISANDILTRQILLTK